MLLRWVFHRWRHPPNTSLSEAILETGEKTFKDEHAPFWGTRDVYYPPDTTCPEKRTSRWPLLPHPEKARLCSNRVLPKEGLDWLSQSASASSTLRVGLFGKEMYYL